MSSSIGWLERVRSVYGATTMASVIRSAVRSVLTVQPVAELVVRYAEWTNDDFDNDTITDHPVDVSEIDRFIRTDRLIAAVDGIDIYNDRSDGYFTIRRPAVSRWFDEPVNGFCTLMAVGGCGGRYYSSKSEPNATSKRNWIVRVDRQTETDDDDETYKVVYHPLSGNIRRLLPTDDEQTLIVVMAETSAYQIDLSGNKMTSTSIITADPVRHAVFYRSPTVPVDRVLVMLYESAICFADLKTENIRVAVMNGNRPTSVVCLPNGVLLLTMADRPGIWFMHPRQVGQTLQRLALRTADWTILAIDDTTANVFMSTGDSVRRIVLPSYVWTGWPITDDFIRTADHPDLASFFAAAS